MDYKTFYDQHWKLVWTSIIVVPPAFIALGCILWPEVFWDNFVWKYIWGPIVADAKRAPQGGVVEGYNPVNTAVYAIILAVAVIGIWRAFHYLRIRLDVAFMVAMVPWVLLGSSARALEDAGLFNRDGGIVYLFISPLIYIFIGLLVFGLVIASHYIQRVAANQGTMAGMLWSGYVLLGFNLVVGVVHGMAPEQMEAHAPYWLLPVISVLGMAVLWWWAQRRDGRVEMTAQVAMYGSVMLTLSLYYVVLWASGDGWGTTERGLSPEELAIIPGIALIATGATMGLFWALSKRDPRLAAFMLPVAMMLFASHYLDGVATWRGIDVHGYSEKHVLPSFLIELAGTAVIMLPLKFLVVVLVVYLMEVALREDLEETPNLAWLVKVAVMVLGLAPGMRDMLRLAMGV
ncbi:MAG: DUF63 family protein [Thermoplasmata archaeon]|nr:MAG: DUF63 family protein [Thermoplasmata archaeon]